MIPLIVQEFNETAELDGYTAKYKKLDLFKSVNEVNTNLNLRKRCRVWSNPELVEC